MSDDFVIPPPTRRVKQVTFPQFLALEAKVAELEKKIEELTEVKKARKTKSSEE